MISQRFSSFAVCKNLLLLVFHSDSLALSQLLLLDAKPILLGYISGRPMRGDEFLYAMLGYVTWYVEKTY